MIKIKNISKLYSNSKYETVKAIDDVSLSLPSTGLIYILGRSGSGKTTLLNVLGGLTDYDFGEISINSKKFKMYSEKEFDEYRRKNIGFVFQEHNLIDYITVYENIEMSCLLSSINFDKNNAIELIESMGLNKEYLQKYPSQLSTGEKQRIAILRAIAKKSNIILADEPTGSLDKENAVIVNECLKRISKDTLVIVVSHNEENANKYGDRIINFSDGKVISDNGIIDCSETCKAKQSIQKKYFSNKINTSLFIKFLKNITFHNKKSIICMIFIFSLSISLLVFSLIVSKFSESEYYYRMLKEDTINNITIVSPNNAISYDNLDNISNSNSNHLVIPIYSKGISINLNDYVDNAVTGKSPLDLKILESNYKYVSVSESELSTMGCDLIAGRYAVKNYDDNEIMISKIVYDSFVKYGFTSDGKSYDINEFEDIVGKSVYSGDDDFTIVGIIDTDFNYDKYEDYLHIEYDDDNINITNLKTYIENGIDNVIFFRDSFYEENIEIDGDPYLMEFEVFAPIQLKFENQHSDIFLITNTKYANENNIYFNDTTTLNNLSSNGVIISKETADKLFDYSNTIENFILQGFTQDVSILKANNLIFLNEDVICSYNLNFINGNLNYLDNASIYIAGIFKDYNNEHIDGITILSDMLYENDHNINFYSMKVKNILIYFSSEKKNNVEMIDKYMYLTSRNDFYIQNQYEDEFNMIVNNTQSIILFSNYLVYLLLPLSVVIIYYFTSLLITNSYKEIGILRAIGVSRFIVLKIYIIQSLCNIILSLSISFFLVNVFLSILNYNINLKTSLNLKLIQPDVRNYLIIYPLLIIIGIFSAFIPITRLTMKKPIDIINKI